MILADKIINERKKLGWSQEELADQLDVSRQSVSKWESAQSTPDLNRLLKMAEIFGVSTDYLLKDEIEEIQPVQVVETADVISVKKEERRPVSMEEASTFLQAVEKTTPLVSLGVSMCIFSPVILLVLIGLSQISIISETLAVIIGLVALLGLVALAVFIFIMTNRELEPYEFLEDVAIDTAYGVDGMVKDKKSKYEKKYTFFIALGVTLCILCSIPLIVIAILTDKTGCEYLVPVMVGVLLTLVAIGVNLIVRGGGIMDSYNKLLQEGGFTVGEKAVTKKTKKLAGLYWPLVLVIYFAWSFTTKRWDLTWIVWPIAGVFFGACRGLIGLVMKD
ncbi:MAG: helix-turn-helix domain-containing protein [Butyrivibrio sp.]|nr:helix-turn-helix domain-containing protein [Butyrivibrio sp.]